MAIQSVKVWSKDWVTNGTTTKEWRIYIRTTDNREGCIYFTGNPWHKKGEQEGRELTEQDWVDARTLGFWDKTWHTMYAQGDSDFQRQRYTNNKPSRCPDCGEIEGPRSGCGGGNCGANRPGAY